MSGTNHQKEFPLKSIEQILSFIVEVEKLKAVLRKTRPVGLDRYENSAEHSWHVCLAALMLKDHANDAVNIDRVLRMLLIHDLGEIDAGDTIVYAEQSAEQKSKEENGVRRLLDMLPASQAEEYLCLWQEFEKGETADALYARAIDRVPPLLHNLHGAGHSWQSHNIGFDQVLKLNSRIEKGSKPLWDVLKSRIQAAKDEGLFAHQHAPNDRG